MKRDTKSAAAMPATVRKLRCAVYTRKSSEEGLDMELNSLDAQRAACEAFIASQTDMAIFWDVREGEGVRLDGTDVWLVTRILEDGTAAELLGPAGQRVTLHEDIPTGSARGSGCGSSREPLRAPPGWRWRPTCR